MKQLVLFAAFISLLGGCGHWNTENAVNCRVDEVLMEPAIDKADYPTCEEKDYVKLCDVLVTRLDATCSDHCKFYYKRSVTDPKNPDISQGSCSSSPVKAVVPHFDAAKHCKKVGRLFEIQCEVSARCGCNPE